MMHKWLQLCCLCAAATIIAAHNYNTRNNPSQNNTSQKTYGDSHNPVTGYPYISTTPTLYPQQQQQQQQKHHQQNQQDQQPKNGQSYEGGATTNAEVNSDRPVQPTQPNSESISSPSQRETRHICTQRTEHFDCVIENVKLRKGETNNFGLDWGVNPQEKVTFQNSKLQYLPKSLFDAFPSMQLLELNDLKIAEFEHQAFQNARKLSILLLQNNRIGTLSRESFEGANQLAFLILSHNGITNMDSYALSTLFSLKNLRLENNRINILPTFYNNRGLQLINASYNSLENIPDTHLTHNLQLKEIDVSHNQIRRFDLQQLNNMTDLSTVDVSFNNLEELHIPGYAQFLNARNNSIASLTSGQCKLHNLNLAFNQIQTISSLKNCAQLKYLDLSYNLLEEFSHQTLSNARQLQYLNLAHNHLFKIDLPTVKLLNWGYLDLSNNYLSHGPKTSSLTQLEILLLNNNRFIDFDLSSLRNLKALFISHNEWRCNKMNDVMDKIRDLNTHQCNPGFKNLNGICCKDYLNPYNDRLNEILRDIHVHEVTQMNELKRKCASTQNNRLQDSIEKNNLDKIRAEAVNADATKRKVLDDMVQVQDDRNKLAEDKRQAEALRRSLNDLQRSLSKEIEKQRNTYGIAKEGLVDDRITLSKVIKFVEDRKVFQNELLSSRRKTSAESAEQIEALIARKAALETENNKLRNVIDTLKQEEKKLKTEKNKLEKQMNKNSAAIQGSSGRVTK